MKQVPMLTAEAAKCLDITPATLRFWERTGKLKAERTISGVRLFSAEDVERLRSERARKAGGDCT